MWPRVKGEKYTHPGALPNQGFNIRTAEVPTDTPVTTVNTFQFVPIPF